MNGSVILFWLLLLCAAGCSGKRECTQPADCDDQNPCTEERCRFERCSWLSIPGCCRTDADCLSGRCSPQTGRCSAGAPVGAPCSQAADCESGRCLAEAASGFPGGYCARTCTGATDCPSGLCLPLGQTSSCLSPCGTDADCRPEYLCLRFGEGGGGCFPHCTENAHCPQAGVCNRWWGLCAPEGPGAENGQGCSGEGVCRGLLCLKEGDSGAPGGLCASLCSPERTACPGAGEACVALWSPAGWGLPLCLPLADAGAPCRPGWAPLLAWNFARQEVSAVCQPACQPADCGPERPCDPWTGLCGADPDDRRGLGQPCRGHPDCKGLCMSFWPGGYCSAPCRPEEGLCPDGGRCVDLGLMAVCLQPCQRDSDCRSSEGYLCHPQLAACVPP